MDEAMLIALRLAKEGFGTPEEILNMPTEIVLSAYDFSIFQADYEETFCEMNKANK